MARPILFGANILETPGAVVTVSGEDADHPKTRLVDSRATFLFHDTSATGTRIYLFDLLTAQAWQGWGIPSVPDRPHNLSGATVSILTSPNGSTTTLRDTYVPTSDATFARRLVAPVTFRYVHLHVAGAASAPRFGELVVAPAFSLGTGPSERSLQAGRRGNVLTHEAQSGLTSALKRGPSAWRARYELRDLLAADWAALEAWYAEIDEGARPFLLLDQGAPGEAAVARWARLLTQDLLWAASGYARRDAVSLEFRQEL